MRRIKRILTASDFTPESAPALHAAARLAEENDAELVIVHSVEHLSHEYAFLAPDISKKLAAKAQTAADAAAKEVGAAHRVKVRTVVKEGSPVEVITGAMQSASSEILVIGAGGATTGGLGDTAKRLAHLCPYDMLIVRKGFEGPFKKILLGTDFSDASTDALIRACRIARREGVTSIVAVNSYEVPSSFHHWGPDIATVRTQMAEYAKQQLAGWLKRNEEWTSGITVEAVILEGSAADVVVDQAKKRGAQLVVVGSHGRTASAAVLLGNVAEEIIRKAPCSVWAERTEAQALSFGRAVARLMGIE